MSHEKFQNCIEACYDCATECDHCAAECLKEENVKAMARCIELDLYCADICRLAATFMARGEKFATQICELCAEICEACGNECESHQMEHCQRCAAACKRCADECRRMAA
jgi:hypothetical protein